MPEHVLLTNRILIVDDDDEFRSIVSDVFDKKGWNVYSAEDATQVIRYVKDFDPHIILMDIDLPGRDGIAVCRIIRNDITIDRYYPIIMMSSSPNKQKIMNAIEAGCDDFVIKPFKFDMLIKKLEKIIELQHMKKTVKKKEGEESENYQKEEQEAEVIVYSREAIKKAFSSAMLNKVIPYQVIKNVANKMLDILHEEKNLPIAFKMKSYNDYIYIHSINVASLCMSFAYHLKWDNSDLEILGEGGFLHDIGKTKVDLQILIKPEKLSESEFTEIKKHPEYARDILAKQHIRDELQKIAIEHHENIDGTGYPHGISNGQISKYGRLAAIVDAYDAITTDRCYNRAVNSYEAIQIMSKQTGKFDTELFGEFKKLVSCETIGK